MATFGMEMTDSLTQLMFDTALLQQMSVYRINQYLLESFAPKYCDSIFCRQKLAVKR